MLDCSAGLAALIDVALGAVNPKLKAPAFVFPGVYGTAEAVTSGVVVSAASMTVKGGYS